LELKVMVCFIVLPNFCHKMHRHPKSSFLLTKQAENAGDRPVLQIGYWYVGNYGMKALGDCYRHHACYNDANKGGLDYER